MNRILGRLRSRVLGRGFRHGWAGGTRAFSDEVAPGPSQKMRQNQRPRDAIRRDAIGCGSRFERGDAALHRLRAAREHFDDSVVALRKAALDHVDVQDLASTAIRANLDRLALSLGRDLGGALASDAVRDA